MRSALSKLLLAVPCMAVLCAATLAPQAAAQTTTLFTISAPSPAAAPAGSGAINVSLAVRQNLDTTLLQQYGLCLYTGVASTAVARNSSTTAANPTFPIPASDFDIPPTSFASGQYTAYLNLQVLGTACSATSALSNSIAFPLSFPTLASVSLAALPQPNSGVAYATYPTNLEVVGANLNSGSGAAFTFTSQTTPGVAFQAGTYLPSAGSIVVPLPTIYETGATGVSLSACNTSAHYRYCSSATTLASFPLAPTTTQLTSSIPSPTVGQATTLTATIIPGPGSATPGGIYVPGPPSGTVTFTDGATPLGTAPLIGSSLTFAAVSPQSISAPSNSGFRIRANARRTRPGARPNDTPTPDNSTAFSSLLADFNLDGVPDTLLLDPNSGYIHLLLGAAPTGNFQPERLIASGCSYLAGAATADLNGDGFPDIAFLCLNDDNTAALFALLNLGDGTFGPPTALLNATGAPLLQYGDQLAAADLNKDGKIDLVVTGSTTVSAFGIQTFFGDGAGHFTVGPVTPTNTDPGTQLVLKDLNNDGAPDLVLLNSSYTTYTTVVQPYLNNGSGVFTPATAIPVCNCFTSTAKLFVTPLTTNALYPDIAVAAPDQQQTLVALNQRTPALAFAPTLTQSIPNLTDAVIGDLNADGLADLVFFDGTTITTLNGDGAGNFAAQPSSPTFTASAANVSLVAAADLNQDGYADLLTLYPGATFTTTLQPYLTTGTATATLPATFSTATTHSLTTTYPGNVNLLGSNGALSLAVTQPAPAYTASLAITAPPSTTPGLSATQTFTPNGTFSLNFTLTQTTDPGQGRGYRTPSGAITVSEHNTLLASATPVSSAPGASVASLPNFGSATTGVHIFTIAYTGDTSFSPITTTYTFTITPAIPIITWSTPANLNTTTPLDSTILNASASVPGAFTYTPASGYLPSGPQTLSALFTPTDAIDYQTITTIRTLNVLKVNPTTSALTASPATQTYLSATPTVLTATLTGLNLTPTGIVQFFDGPNSLGTPTLAATATPATAAVTFSLPTLSAGPHAFKAVYTGDSVYNASTATLAYTVGPAAPVLTYAPTPATITYGATLVTTQLNAAANTAAGAAIPGSFTYNHAAGDLLPAGSPTLTATFTPADPTSFQSGSISTTLTVNKATPTITFPTAPTAVVGTPLSSLQLTPTVTGISGPNLPGVITFTPNTGLVTAGPQTLNVTFTPTDTADYNPATATVTLNGTALTLAALSSSTAQLGNPALTLTLTGTGFLSNSIARANGGALTTTFVNSTTLTALIPASNFLAIQTLQITVFNPTQSLTTAALPFSVTPAPIGPIIFSGPSSANSGDQPTIRFALTNPYPVDLTATLTLTFAPIAGGVDDPAIQFRNGGRTFTFNLTAGQTISPTIQLQSGTVAGTIQVALAIFITNGNINVTPSSLSPILITIAPAPPAITAISVTRTGRQLTVSTFGLSNTRAITQAAFHFTPAAGQQIQTQDIPLDVTSLFSGWYTQAVSDTYGSTFLYTQTFTLDDDATVVGQVTLILSNGVGASASGSSN